MLVDCLGDKPAGAARAPHAQRALAAIIEDFMFASVRLSVEAVLQENEL